MQALIRRSILIYLFTSALLYAGEKISIDCINLLVEKDTDVLLISRGDKSYIVGSGEGQSEFVKLLNDLTEESIGNPNIAKFVSPGNDPNFFSALESTEPALGANALSGAERVKIDSAKKEINTLTTKRGEFIIQHAKEIKQNNKGMHIDEAKKRAREEMQDNADYVWNELQITRKKAELVDIYQDKLGKLGIDIYATPNELAASLKKVDPFEMARFGRPKFPFNRGEKVDIQVLEQHFLQKKFSLHEAEFTPPLRSSADYLARVKKLAHSEDPRIISFKAKGGEREVHTMIYKYDPVTNELLVVNAETKIFITYFHPGRRSETNPRGYNFNLTPFQFVLMKYYR